MGSTYRLCSFLVKPFTDLYIKLNTCEKPLVLLAVIVICSHIFRCAHFPAPLITMFGLRTEHFRDFGALCYVSRGLLYRLGLFRHVPPVLLH